MLRFVFHKKIREMEEQFDYDAEYLHEVTEYSLPAAIKFSMFQIMASHRENVPPDAWFAAKLGAVMHEDCGPCAQLVVDMALAAGMRAHDLTALARGAIEDAGIDAAFGFRYGQGVAANTLDAQELSCQAEQRYGKRGRISLALAVASARVYPVLKRGLGHGAACQKLIVANESIILNRAA